MGRILFFLLLGVALYVGFRIWRAGPRNSGPARTTGDGDSESMVRCGHCGLNLPRSEALQGEGDWYCSEAHRRLGHVRR